MAVNRATDKPLSSTIYPPDRFHSKLDGTAPADLTLTKLARALPYCWAEQERRVGTSASSSGAIFGWIPRSTRVLLGILDGHCA
jgi:hypothetical protein